MRCIRNIGNEKIAKMKKENIVITDNFLPKEEFIALRDTITEEGFPWYFSKTKTYEENLATSPGQFNHIAYANSVPTGQFFLSHFEPIMGQLNSPLLARIKLNLNPRLPEPYYSDFHIDPELPFHSITDQLTTSIFYMNTNNGYTEFEDGTKVESVANRLVSFPANTRHRGVTQTDEQTKIVINFNYLKLRK